MSTFDISDSKVEVIAVDTRNARSCNTAGHTQNLCDAENEGEMEDVRLDERSVISTADDSSSNSMLKEDVDDNVDNHNRGEVADVRDEDDKSVEEEQAVSSFEKQVNLIKSKVENNTVVIHSVDEMPDETFQRLQQGLHDKTLTHKEIVDSVFNTLVGGTFDIESNFIIRDSRNINRLLHLLDRAPSHLKAEIWSVFIGVVRKSARNMQACSRVGLVLEILERLSNSDAVVSDLLIQLLGVLTTYSITVKETKRFLRALKAVNRKWRKNSIKLLDVLGEMPKRDGADVFFSFPGVHSAGIALPPLTKWPYQNGWSFCTWLKMDPLNSVNFEKERPYIYCFRTTKGLGYNCYIMGNCLVISCIKVVGKETARCIRFELTPRRWHHVAISHIYSRWSKSEIQCFVDGQMIESFDVPWFISTTEHFDKCSIGCGPDGEEPFCGQIAALYVFSEALSAQQVNAIFCLGSSYQSCFLHEAEADLSDDYKKFIFDGKLSASVVIAYSPKNCDGQLCLHSASKTGAPYFVQVPHAIMKEGVEVVKTYSIHNSLHSLGGIQMLLPLFSQLDFPQYDGNVREIDVCSKLLSAISLLLRTASNAPQQLYHSRAFLVISQALYESSPSNLSQDVLEILIDISKYLLAFPSGTPLLKHLFDYILFNPELWSRADPTIQIQLYYFLASEFLTSANFMLIVQRCATVVEVLHTIKLYYWVVMPHSPSLYNVISREGRLSRNEVITIRAHMLTFVSRLICLPDPKESGIMNRDGEFNALLNFIATVNEDDNLYDVLALTTRLLCEKPAAMVPAFDRKKGLAVVFKLINSVNELVRIPALKIFGYFLCRSTLKRKTDSVSSLNLLSLVTDRLLLNATHLTLATYNVLFEILTEQMTPTINYLAHASISDVMRFENPTMLKVITNLITQSENNLELMKVKRIFLEDLLRMCKNSRDNRRTILQMSVWQEWLISLAYIFPKNENEVEISELVYHIFAELLFHAIYLEYGGWRVWVDTLAIAHSKVSWERHQIKFHRGGERETDVIFYLVQNLVSSVARTVDGLVDEVERKDESKIPADQLSSIYRTPEFCWSDVHLRLLDDLLVSIENTVEEWKKGTATILDVVNSNENSIFVANCVHVLSQLIDLLVMACGGLLPLLAAATSPNSELEIMDSTNQTLAIGNAARLLARFVVLADVFVFASGISFSDLEQEKNMPNGGILRQTLRLVSTVAVRNILASRIKTSFGKMLYMDAKQVTRAQQIAEFVSDALDVGNKEGILDPEHLVQEVDLQRLRGVIYRDMEENRQAQFLALAVTYLLSVLMVSRYRDILEPPSIPSPFFDTTITGGTNKDCGNSLRQVDEESCTEENGELSNHENNTVDKNVFLREQSSILLEENKEKELQSNIYRQDHLDTFNDSSLANRELETGERRAYLTTKLQKALETTAPLLREILTDFRSYLQKTLLGTHGQEIMNDSKVMETMKNQARSVIELVMLLCSQEWQTSLQKHAGLAFIELVNEGRLMAHATRDHILRVANEADFILNRLRAEDISKHAQFESDAAEQMHRRRKEEQVNDHLVTANRRRDLLVSARLLERLTSLLSYPGGAWNDPCQHFETFWKLDVWEDDSRRRKRFVLNPYGCHHSAACLKAVLESKSSDKEVDKAREDLLRDLVAQRLVSLGSLKPGSTLGELVDETDFEKWATEPDVAIDLQREKTTYGTAAKLIAPGIVVPGTLSITNYELFFDADEDDPLYKEQDPKVTSLLLNFFFFF
uniref:BEACH-type PH domain-containing protein n=1 Tax=Wuchereria bancrofti TaxID=6293 RepID=A0AAF5RXM1_WUCBA